MPLLVMKQTRIFLGMFLVLLASFLFISLTGCSSSSPSSVASPTFSPAAGTYNSVQTVTISSATPGAAIFYTTNGSVPAGAFLGTPYTGPITVSSTETINAIATYSNDPFSPAISASYTLTTATPTISPAAGTYTTIQTVTIADATAGATIYYTLDGSTPTKSSTPYTGPITVSATETVNAIAMATNFGNSAVATAAYTINLPTAAPPTLSPAAGTYTAIQTVTIADATPSATIYYTLNGGTPTTSSTPYTGPITVSATEVVKAMAVAPGYINSAFTTADYTINLPNVATPTFSPAAGTYTTVQTVTIVDAIAGASIYYTTDGSTPTASSTPYTGPIPVATAETVNAIAIAIGYNNSAVASAAYTLNLPPAATPTFSPAAGASNVAQTVTIADATAGATIYYTLNGSTPTTSSTLYTGPITVSATETINAIAVATGYNNSSVATATYTILSALNGTVLTGTQVVSGATVRLYAAGSGGYGSGSTSIATAVTTNASGQFTLEFACPSSSSQIYVLADGGNPGLASGTNNAYLALMTALGPCGVVAASSPAMSVTVNEVTTVASVWALQQFMASPTVDTTQGIPAIGTSAATYNGVQTGIIGLQNAFSMVNNLVNVSTGSAAAPTNSWATPETTNLNTIADILATCNSTGGSTSCNSLMSDATPTSATKAADTIQAAWYMAQNPGNNVSALYSLITGTPPFADLSSAPYDFTIAVNLAPQYTTTSTLFALSDSYYVAIDAYGNVWVSNNGGVTGSAPASVVELAPNGNVIMNPVSTFTASTTGGAYSQFTTHPGSNTITISTPRMVAVDTTNNVWVANFGNTSGTPAAGTLATFTGSTGVGVAGSSSGGYYVGNSPFGIAIDGHNNVYESNIGTTGMDPLSIGKIAAGTGSYTYTTGQIPNTKLGGGNVQLSPLAIDTNTTTTGGLDGILWSASTGACQAANPSYLSGDVAAWGVIDMFDADTLGELSGSEVVSGFSGATTGAGSTTNCGTSTASGAGLQIEQVITPAMANPASIAIDKNNGVWIADGNWSGSNGFNGLTYFQAPTASAGLIPNSTYWINSGHPLSSGVYANNANINSPSYLEVDGNNNVWGANWGLNVITEASYSSTSNTISLINAANQTWHLYNSDKPYGMAIDPSGNIWTTNSTAGASGYYTGNPNGPTGSATGGAIYDSNSMTVLVGVAGPVVTPLSQRVQSNVLGQKP